MNAGPLIPSQPEPRMVSRTSISMSLTRRLFVGQASDPVRRTEQAGATQQKTLPCGRGSFQCDTHNRIVYQVGDTCGPIRGPPGAPANAVPCPMFEASGKRTLISRPRAGSTLVA